MSEQASTTTTTETQSTTQAAGTSLLAGAETQAPITAPWKGFAGEDGTFAQDWHNHLPDDLGESRGSLSKFKDLPSFAKAHIELERKLGSRANEIVLPGEKATPEEVAKFRKSLGIPEKAEEYSFKPEKMPDGTEWSDDAAKPFAEWAHKNNIPPAKMKELAAMHFEHMAMIPKAHEQVLKQEHDQAVSQLKTDYGDNFAKNLTKASQVAKILGADPQDPVFGDPKVVRLLVSMSEKLSEDNFTNRDGSPMLPDAAAQANDIISNPSNPYHERYMKGDPQVKDMVKNGLALAAKKMQQAA